MKTKIILTIVFLCFLLISIVGYFSLAQIYSGDYSDSKSNNPKISIKSETPSWVTVKATGKESELIFWSSNRSEKKAEIGWIPASGSCVGYDTRFLYYKNGSLIPDINGKEIAVTCQNNKCDGKPCYYEKLSDSEMANIDDYVSLGNDSTASAFEEEKKVGYETDWFSFNATLFIEINNDWNNTINSIFVFDNPDKKKFGANVTGFNETRKFRYVIESDSQILEDNFYKFYLSHAIEGTCNGMPCTQEERHIIDLSDICSINFNGTGYFNPDCYFSEINNESGIWKLNVEFYAQYNFSSNYISIDPTIVVGQVNQTASTKNNITCENYPLCHITLNSSQKLTLYYPFDVNLTTNTNITYDYSGRKNDGTQVVKSLWTEGWDGGGVRIGGGYGDNYINALSPTNLDNIIQKNKNMTIMFWIKIGANYGESATLNYIVAKGDTPGDPAGSWRLGVNAGTTLFNFGRDFSGTDLDISTASGTAATERWIHLAITANNETNVSGYKIYINGTSMPLTATNGTGTAVSDASNNLYIGSGSYLTRTINATIDEFMIFNRSLSSAEITGFYNNQSYRFNTPATQTFLVDLSNNYNINTNMINVSFNATIPSKTNITVRVMQGQSSLPETVINYTYNSSSRSWTNPNNVLYDDSLNATVIGMYIAPGSSISIRNVTLLKDGVATGTSYTTGNIGAASSQANITHGAANDTWGTTWTAENINNASFGIRYSFIALGNVTNYLNITNFSFSIPANSVIYGISSIAQASNEYSGTGILNLDFVALTVVYNNSNNIEWQTATSNGNQLNFSLNNNLTSVYLVFNYTADQYNFFSPITSNSITIETWTGEDAPADSFYPMFYGYWDNNGTFIDNGLGKFNVSINNTNGTSGIYINNSNYTLTNVSNVFTNISVNFTKGGVYPYFFWSYGNGTNHNYNQSALRYYTVNSTVAQANYTVNQSIRLLLNLASLKQFATKKISAVYFAINSATNRIEKASRKVYQSISVNSRISKATNAIRKISQVVTISVYNSRLTNNIRKVYQSLSAVPVLGKSLQAIRNLIEVIIINLGLNTNYTAASGDTTPPVLETIPDGISVGYGANIDNLNLEFYATDNVAVGSFSVNNSNFAIYTRYENIEGTDYGIGKLGNISTVPIGNYYLNVSVNDTSGNSNYVIYNINITVDTTPPWFEVIPDGQIQAYGDEIFAEFVADDDGAINVFYVNDSRFQIATTYEEGEGNWFWFGRLTNISNIPPGVYYINVSMDDISGNWNSTIWNLNVTGSVPSTYSQNASVSIGIKSVINRIYSGIKNIGESIYINYKEEDILKSLRSISVSGKLVVSQNRTRAISKTLSDRLLITPMNRIKNFFYRAITQIINVIGLGSKKTSFDSTPPVITVYNPLDNGIYESSSLGVNLSAVDDVGIDSYWYSLDGGITNYSFLPNITLYDLGYEAWHTLDIWVNDTSNNIANEEISYYIGTDNTTKQYFYLYVFLFIVAIIIFLIGYYTQNKFINIFGSLIFIAIGIALWTVGYPGLDDELLKKSVSFAILFIGVIIMIINSIRIAQEGVD